MRNSDSNSEILCRKQGALLWQHVVGQPLTICMQHETCNKMILAQVVGINEDLKLNIKFGAGSSEYFFYFILKFLTIVNIMLIINILYRKWVAKLLKWKLLLELLTLLPQYFQRQQQNRLMNWAYHKFSVGLASCAKLRYIFEQLCHSATVLELIR